MKDVKFLKSHNVDVEKSIELFGDLETYNETMVDFLDGIETKKERLENAKSKNDFANYAVFAHSIKSDARYLGFTDIAEVAYKHEVAGKEDNQKFISEDYIHLLSSVKSMEDVVKSYLYEEADDEIVSFSNVDRETIFVIDDSELITNLIVKKLEENYKVSVCNDGTEAKKYIDNNFKGIKMILLDLNMPDISGFDILEYLKEKELFKDINVSIITGDESEDTIKKAFTYPIVDMLSKPFGTEELTRVVEKTFNR